MTSKQDPDQEQRPAPERAVWLARVPTGTDADNGSATGGQRFEAHKTARKAGAAVVAEFFWSADQDRALSNTAWRELLAFVRHARATVLVVLGPREIADRFDDYFRRTTDLEAEGVRLMSPEGMGLADAAPESDADARAA